MTDSNQLSYLVMAFCLGLCAGASLLTVVTRMHGERLRRKLSDGGLRVTDGNGATLSASELTKLFGAAFASGTAVSSARLLWVSLAAALAAAVLVIAGGGS